MQFFDGLTKNNKSSWKKFRQRKPPEYLDIALKIKKMAGLTKTNTVQINFYGIVPFPAKNGFSLIYMGSAVQAPNKMSSLRFSTLGHCILVLR